MSRFFIRLNKLSPDKYVRNGQFYSIVVIKSKKGAYRGKVCAKLGYLFINKSSYISTISFNSKLFSIFIKKGAKVPSLLLKYLTN